MLLPPLDSMPLLLVESAGSLAVRGETELLEQLQKGLGDSQL